MPVVMLLMTMLLLLLMITMLLLMMMMMMMTMLLLLLLFPARVASTCDGPHQETRTRDGLLQLRDGVTWCGKMRRGRRDA
jgi:hypothetical protein